MNNQSKINKLADKLDLKFKNPEVFENAFVHRSYLNENPHFKLDNNERLEFLGDAVLELAVTRFLFEKFNKPEGELTLLRSALVKGKNLSQIASDLGVFECLYLSAGERKGSTRARELILANTLEAMIGAIYLDLGFERAEQFVQNYVAEKIDEIVSVGAHIDAKSLFQEKIQEKLKITPNYKVLEEAGPDHNKVFTSGVFIGDEVVAKGQGPSRGRAEQEAAEAALKKMFLVQKPS